MYLSFHQLYNTVASITFNFPTRKSTHLRGLAVSERSNKSSCYYSHSLHFECTRSRPTLRAECVHRAILVERGLARCSNNALLFANIENTLLNSGTDRGTFSACLFLREGRRVAKRARCGERNVVSPRNNLASRAR